jgi:hypothetical protein
MVVYAGNMIAAVLPSEHAKEQGLRRSYERRAVVPSCDTATRDDLVRTLVDLVRVYYPAHPQLMMDRLDASGLSPCERHVVLRAFSALDAMPRRCTDQCILKAVWRELAWTANPRATTHHLIIEAALSSWLRVGDRYARALAECQERHSDATTEATLVADDAMDVDAVSGEAEVAEEEEWEVEEEVAEEEVEVEVEVDDEDDDAVEDVAEQAEAAAGDTTMSEAVLTACTIIELYDATYQTRAAPAAAAAASGRAATQRVRDDDLVGMHPKALEVYTCVVQVIDTMREILSKRGFAEGVVVREETMQTGDVKQIASTVLPVPIGYPAAGAWCIERHRRPTRSSGSFQGDSYVFTPTGAKLRTRMEIVKYMRAASSA